MDHRTEIDELVRSVLETPGETTREQRDAAFRGEVAGTSIDAYLAKVRDASYRVVDADVERLGAEGWSQDAILELTLAAAVGAAFRTFDAGIRALEAR